MLRTITPVLMLLAVAGPVTQVLAQEAGPALGLQLNRVDQIEGACRLTFLAENALGADVGALSLETVLLDTDGIVERLTIFDFGALPDGIPRVRQFDVPGLACADLARVLVNAVADCDAPVTCEGRLDYSTLTEVEVIG